MFDFKSVELSFIFDKEISLRNYIESGFFERLSQTKKFKIYLLSGESPVDSNLKISRLKVTRLGRTLLSINSNLYWIKIRKRSSIYQTLTNFKYFVGCSSFAVGATRRSGIKVTIGIAWILRLFQIHKLGFPWLSLILRRPAFNGTKIIYITVGGPLSISDALWKFCKKSGLPFGLIYDNWDGIATKAVLQYKPNMVGVWGEQGAQIAERLHDLKKKQIALVGNPKIDFIVEETQKLETENRKDMVLFAGGSIDYKAELNFLEFTHEFMKRVSSGLHLRYLPHPKLYEMALKNQEWFFSRGIVILNGAENASKGAECNLFIRSLFLYPKLYAKSVVLISSFSTMNIEAALVGVPSIALNLSYPNLGRQSRHVTKYMEHLKGPDLDRLLYVVNSNLELSEVLTVLLTESASKYSRYHKEDSFRSFYDCSRTFDEKFADYLDALG